MVKIVNSFSGGESSAYQAVLMQNIYGDGIVNVFANTGNERPETLDFVQRFSTEHSLDVVWVEAVVHPHGEGTTHRIVNHNSAHMLIDGSLMMNVLMQNLKQVMQ